MREKFLGAFQFDSAYNSRYPLPFARGNEKLFPHFRGTRGEGRGRGERRGGASHQNFLLSKIAHAFPGPNRGFFRNFFPLLSHKPFITRPRFFPSFFLSFFLFCARTNETSISVGSLRPQIRPIAKNCEKTSQPRNGIADKNRRE